VGVVLVCVKRDAARGTIWEAISQPDPRFLVGLIIAVIALAVCCRRSADWPFHSCDQRQSAADSDRLARRWCRRFMLGLLLIWFLYRTMRGLIRAIESKPY
jgi:hypothetical protein